MSNNLKDEAMKRIAGDGGQQAQPETLDALASATQFGQHMASRYSKACVELRKLVDLCLNAGFPCDSAERFLGITAAPSPSTSQELERSERDEIIRNLRKRHSAIEIASMVGLTRQRVHQILREVDTVMSAAPPAAE